MNLVKHGFPPKMAGNGEAGIVAYLHRKRNGTFVETKRDWEDLYHENSRKHE